MLALSGAVVIASLGASLVAAFAYVAWIGLTAPTRHTGFNRVLVLGMRLRPDGTIPQWYRWRLERALILLRAEQNAEAILLGGTTVPAHMSEAEAGRVWLRDAGVAATRIRTEDRSRHTLENLRHYRADFHAGAMPPVLVTNRFHLARSSLIASGLGIAHARCTAETASLLPWRQLPAMLKEAKLIHWYVVGRTYSRLTRHQKMAARIS